MNLSSSTSTSSFLVLKPESLPDDVVLLLIAVSITLFNSDIPNGLVFLNWTKKFFFKIFFKPLDGLFLGQTFCKPRCKVPGIVSLMHSNSIFQSPIPVAYNMLNSKSIIVRYVGQNFAKSDEFSKYNLQSMTAILNCPKKSLSMK